MDTDYVSDTYASVPSHPLPSSAGTLSRSTSRRNSTHNAPGSDTSSPPSIPPQSQRKGAEDVANDENISVLDPRRFTPTLHANLVSEILNLRRELDSKHTFIEDLETDLYRARVDKDSLVKQLSASTKDSRTIKRQLQQFENETLAALEEIAGERDKHKDTITELRDKLEQTQKKSRMQEDDSTRVHHLWAKEKETWTGEKQALERRVQLSESRLKMLLEEIAMHEAAHEEAGHDSGADDMTRDENQAPESDTASIRSSPQRRSSTRIGRHSRNRSNSSYRSIGRNYRMSLLSFDGYGRSNGLSLADELIFDEEEEDLGDLELDSDDFPENEMRARKALESRQSMMSPDEKAKRILGLSIENQLFSRDHAALEESEPRKTSHETGHSSITLTPRDITLVFPPTRPIYVDTGVQPSPPPSPTRPSMAEASSQTTGAAVQLKLNDVPTTAAEIEANQSRKRTSVSPGTSPSLNISLATSAMTSSAVQTIEPLSPPATPKMTTASEQLPISPTLLSHPVSASTQTDSREEPTQILKLDREASQPLTVIIPSITIHAPSSAPSSPKEPILPPCTKTISTQTTWDLAAPIRSYGIQTEPIRIDQRSVKLPSHLLPSSISSEPGTPEPKQLSEVTVRGMWNDPHFAKSNNTEAPAIKSAARQDLIARLEHAAERKVENRYPGNNDNGPLSRFHQPDLISRPFRTSSLFAGFDGPSSDEEEDDDFGDDSDDDYSIPQFSSSMLSSRNAKSGRPVNPPTPVPEDKESSPQARPSVDSLASKRSSLERPAKVGKATRTTITRQPSIRRSVMIQNGTAVHAHSRSPSIDSVTSGSHVPKPPFPVPSRSSSRKPSSKSEGSQSPTPRNGNSHAGRRPYGVNHQRKESLRKVRSAAPIVKPGRSRSRSPNLPATPSIADTSSILPLPSDVASARGFNHRHQLSNATAFTANGSIMGTVNHTSVVDAIAASMIGEFMWKYIRRRKTFGGPDTPVDVSRAAEEASLASYGVRHKRWVWISPYERAILWSSKQPTSGSALMGKSGRKLVIQSVLDVADACPPPKNETLFNRSILILTPARALKFTATSRERHYLWLTALSFLAHTSSPMPNLDAMPPAPAPPPVEEYHRPQGAILRRSRVQDSVRLAKGRANPVKARYAAQGEPMPSLPSLTSFETPISDPASPPVIPRGPQHGRKRSSTGPSAPPPTVPFRSFSHQHVPSVYSNVSSDVYSAGNPSSAPSTVYNGNSGAISSRTSEAGSSIRQPFFDTMGTVRMEAFVAGIDNTLDDPKQLGGHIVKAQIIRPRGSGQWSATARDPCNRSGGLFEDFDAGGDPFCGF